MEKVYHHEELERLNRNDVIEKRAKCIVCGYELTYPEYVNDDKCVFHSEFTPKWGFLAWLRFALSEYRVMRFKLNMAQHGMDERDYSACVGFYGEDIGNIASPTGMEALLKELKNYKAWRA